ncbi:dDENN domain-containing protein [Rhizodiscina lignyota]|uniref:DDENN domain-containing protein n=1 Tax=Rhizodiscina lignyota TaxID=1504668 RepID=A0A9P4M802_9PEZI|nr:dDENN domain-containing protein [Rhizodiscina lignyota]
MAPIATAADLFPGPLADYFFICGIESSQIFDEKSAVGPVTPAVDATIEENEVLETDPEARPKSTELEIQPTQDAGGRRSRMSYETRKSISSFIQVDSGRQSTSPSNRSSATIKGIQQIGGSGLNDVEFESALRKFASERDSFLEEINFSAGVVAQPPKRPSKSRPKAQRIVSDEGPAPLQSRVGTLKRRISTMSSLKRQPSMVRQASIRTSRRLSGYNSVIPAPQPFIQPANMHPLKRRYEPVMLDRYPPKDMAGELMQRKPFPDYVPMFTFPNDVTVVSSDERPRSTWHGFAMTNQDSSRLYGLCLIMWLPLGQIAAEDLERQCEEWRKANMTQEERELAGSLGERLASERAKLSKLLAQLPTWPQASDEREQLEEDISGVEERIALITEMLHPIRHGASSRIEGLTESETGLWIPRAYGIMGRDPSMTGFWKEWLRAIVTPMTNGAVLRVPASSPKIGMWQPLERYVVNLCAEATSPTSSITQVELAIRELKLYARKEAVNELPGSRSIDLFALFRSLSLPNIVVLFEYVLSESRIILLSSYTSMLHLASAAITNLLYPLKWQHIFIPVLPSRLVQALEAPCPYIVGVERRYENLELPDDDFVLVDLDQDTIEATAAPRNLPRQQRRKLMSLLQLSAPHHHRFGVPVGPPDYAKEAFPHDAFSSENQSVFNAKPGLSTLAQLVSLNSTSFADSGWLIPPKPPIFNAFLQSGDANGRGSERPATSSTSSKTGTSPPSPRVSPVSTAFPPLPSTPISRSDSGYALQATLREKRSGHFDTSSRRSSSFVFERHHPTMRRPSQPFLNGYPTNSPSNLNNEYNPSSTYAPSVYAQSTLAASTVMPGILMQPVRNSETTKWVEGHCLNWRQHEDKAVCAVCDEKSDDGIYRCSGCNTYAHGRCAMKIYIVCPAAFHADQIRAAFVRCFASLLYTYRRFLGPANSEQKKNGMMSKFSPEGFLRSMPHEAVEYMQEFQQTQAFNEFIHERETTRADDPSIKLFDQIILSKKNRGRTSLFSKSSTDFLTDTSDHIWRTAAATPPSARFPGDYREVVTRVPSKLDPALLKEPRVIQGMPRMPNSKAKRKPISSMIGSKKLSVG